MPSGTPVVLNFVLWDTYGRLIKNTNSEAHSQFVVRRFLRPRDTVIELGGGIGTNSVQINMKLCSQTKSKHFVFEPQAELVDIIRRNAKLHASKFTVVHGVLSKKKGFTVPSFSPVKKDWIGVKATFKGRGRKAPSVSTLPIIPSVVVADCEGCLLQVLQEFPEILDRIRMVYYENDGGAEVHKGLRRILAERGMQHVVNAGDHQVFLRSSSGAPAGRTRMPRSGMSSSRGPRRRASSGREASPAHRTRPRVP